MVWLVGYVDPPIRPSTLPRIQGPGSKFWIQVTDQIPGSRDHVSQGHRPWIQVTDQGFIQGKTMKPDPETRDQIPETRSRVLSRSRSRSRDQRPNTRFRVLSRSRSRNRIPSTKDHLPQIQRPITRYPDPRSRVQGPSQAVRWPTKLGEPPKYRDPVYTNIPLNFIHWISSWVSVWDQPKYTTPISIR